MPREQGTDIILHPEVDRSLYSGMDSNRCKKERSTYECIIDRPDGDTVELTDDMIEQLSDSKTASDKNVEKAVFDLEEMYSVHTSASV